MMDGMILIDKPAGISSFGAVARVRRKLTEEARAQAIAEGRTPPKRVKVGHTGTLDPFATGLLILLYGKMTKHAEEYLRHDKEYIATVRLGATSTTGDPEGEIREVWNEDVKLGQDKPNIAAEFAQEKPNGQIELAQKKPNKQAVENVVENMVGENWQRVPAYSAVKINGQRAYKLARAGKQVQMPERKITIYEMEILSYEWPFLKIRCMVSAGTYVRAIGEEIGRKLGVGAYLVELRRTKIGDFDVKDAQQLLLD